VTLYQGATVTLMLGLGVTTSYTDLTTGKVLNRHLVLFLLACVGIDCLALLLTPAAALALTGATVVNTAAGLALAILLYVARVWPAGDAKLFALFVFMVPAGLCSTPFSDFFWGFAIVVNAFVFAYLFLLGETAVRWGTQVAGRTHEPRRKAEAHGARDTLFGLTARVAFAVLTGMLLNTLVAGVMRPEFYARNAAVTQFVVFVVLILVLRRVGETRTYWALAACEVLSVALLHLTGMLRLRFAIPTAGIVATVVIVLLARYLGSRFDYEEIPIDRLATGSVLSPASYAYVASRLKSIRVMPNQRLRDEDVGLIVGSHSLRRSCSRLCVVRKVTFAPFIFAGVLVQLALSMTHLH
jgi:Flp pilus assembly protein protease CpaA